MSSISEELKKTPLAIPIFLFTVIIGIINNVNLGYLVVKNDTSGLFLNAFFYILAFIAPILISFQTYKNSDYHWILKLITTTFLGIFLTFFIIVIGSQSYFHFGDRITVSNITEEIITNGILVKKDLNNNHGPNYIFVTEIKDANREIRIHVNKFNYDTIQLNDTFKLKYFKSTGGGICVKYGDVIQP